MDGSSTARTAARSAIALAALVAACAPAGPGPTGTDAGDEVAHSITLAWDAPETDAVGDPLADLAGYRLYYSDASPIDPATANMVDTGMSTTHTLTGLAPGTFHFAVSAVDEAGNESELTPELTARLGPP